VVSGLLERAQNPQTTPAQELLYGVHDAGAFAAEQDDAANEFRGVERLEELDAVNFRHVQVADDDVDWLPECLV